MSFSQHVHSPRPTDQHQPPLWPGSGVEQPSLEEAYEACRLETQHWAKTYYLGSLLMPPEKRRAIWAIYVWCRRTDELVDSSDANTMAPSQLHQRLNRWEERTRRLFAGEVNDAQDMALWDTLQRYPQDIHPYLEMIAGQRMDVDRKRYETFEQLKLYCYRVAGTVGLMSQRVMGLDNAFCSAPWSQCPDPTNCAVALGIASQLTNILRDVGEDRGRGRIYIPQDELARFNYTEAELMAGVINEPWRALMKFQVQRAREWFHRSELGIRWLCQDARWPVWTSLRLYRGILGVIEDNGYDVFSCRAYVPRLQKLLNLSVSFLLAQSR